MFGPTATRVLVLALVVLALSRVASAAESARAMFTLVVNTVSHGEAVVLLEADDVLVTPQDLASAGLANLPAGRVEMRGGVAYRSLRALGPGLVFAIDDQDFLVNITVSPDVFPTTAIDLASPRPADLSYRRDTSGFLNYSFQLANGIQPSAFAEGGASVAGDLLYTSMALSPEMGAVRFLTNVTVDDSAHLSRWIFGDATATTGALGSALFMGGITYGRSWDLDPYFVRAPTLGYGGVVATPSMLDVYVNGVMVRREAIAPGPFQLQNVKIPNGAGVVSYVVRDAFGGERAISSDYYLAPGVLAEGVAEYNATLGFVRKALGTESFSYGALGFLGKYRYALSNVVTAGGRVELGADVASAGAMSSIALPFGALDLAVSGDWTSSGLGAAALAGYSYNGSRSGVSLFGQWMSARYATLGMLPGDDRATVTWGAASSISLGRRATLGTQQTFSLYRDVGLGARSSASLTVQLARAVNLFFNGGRTVTSAAPTSLDAFGGLVFSLDAGINLSGGARLQAGSNEVFAAVDKSLPAGDGLGIHADGAVGNTSHGRVILAAQSPYGIYHASYENVGGNPQTLVQAAGGVVAVAGAGVFMTRPTQNGFAVVEVPGARNVRVMLNNQEVGRTGSGGMFSVPNLLPYYGNRLGIVDSDLPLDYAVSATELLIAPPYRGGALVRFPAKRVRYARGLLTVRRGGKDVPSAYGELVMRVAARRVVSPLGAKGEFELELDDVEPGRYPASVAFEGGTCEMTITVPAFKEMVQDLGKIQCTAQ